MDRDGDDAMGELNQLRMSAAITAKTFGVRKIDTDDLQIHFNYNYSAQGGDTDGDGDTDCPVSTTLQRHQVNRCYYTLLYSSH